MEIGRLRAFLRAHRRVALDTCIFIYQWESNRRYSQVTDHIFAAIELGDIACVTSTITMTELLVHPYRNRDTARVNELFALLSTYPNLEWIPADIDVAARAAEIRALHGLRTPDALQAATAERAGATAFVTNDPIFERISSFHHLVLDRLV